MAFETTDGRSCLQIGHLRTRTGRAGDQGTRPGGSCHRACLLAEPPPPPTVRHARRTAETRLELIREHGASPPSEIADRRAPRQPTVRLRLPLALDGAPGAVVLAAATFHDWPT